MLIQILAVGLPIIALDTVLATALVASNRLKGYLVVAAIAAVAEPDRMRDRHQHHRHRYGNGAIGAAIVTVVTELWVMVGALHFRSPGVVDRAEVGRIGRIVAATAAMVPFLCSRRAGRSPCRCCSASSSTALASLAFGSITSPSCVTTMPSR